MEPKVVNKLLSTKGNMWQYSKDLSFTKQEGSGNNWAYGYNVHGPRVEEDVLDMLNKLLDYNPSIQVSFLILIRARD
jgi:tubulin delta